MIEKKNIDRLFQEKFKDFEAVPDEKVWQNIEGRLKKKKKRRVVPIWWASVGVAALLLIGLLIWNFAENSTPGNGVVNIEPEIPVGGGNPVDSLPVQIDANKDVFMPESVRKDHIVSDDKPRQSATDNIPGETPPKNPEEKTSVRGKLLEDRFQNDKIRNNAIAGSEKRNKQTDEMSVQNSVDRKDTDKGKDAGNAVAISEKQKRSLSESDGQNVKNQAEKINPIQQSPTNGSQEIQIAESDREISRDFKPDNISKPNNNSSNDGEIQIAETDQKKQDSVKAAGPDSMEELLKEKETGVAVNGRKVNRWQISSNVAPIYFSSVSNGSPIDPRFKDNPKAYKPTVSYGVGVQYNINKKLAVRSGINAFTLEYNTTEVLISQTPEARKLENVKPNARGSLIQVDNVPVAATMTLGRTISQFGGNLNQATGYVEVPVELTYKILDRKFGIDVVGGISTLFLNKNEVSIESSGAEINIGEAENLNDVHFSTNIGVGFRYNFLKNFQATVEPVFKYQINTFTNDVGGFKPYLFGLYTGVNYRF